MKLFGEKIFTLLTLVFTGMAIIFGGYGKALALDAELTTAPKVPAPLNREATTVKVEFEAIETVRTLTDDTKYKMWTFNGTVPGPMIRIKEGDVVEFTLKNNKSNNMIHSIDIHAVNGPHGGGNYSQVKPGEDKTFKWKSLAPGLYVYHCASPHIPTHIANGMYGMLLVEPQKGLKKVDHEYYVMQGEFYTMGGFGAGGIQDFSHEKALRENPDYVVFNGSVGALTGKGSLTAKAGDTVRIFMGNAGPNLISSFHVIGEIFDRVYHEGSFNQSAQNVQTTLIPAAGSTVVEFKVDNPGTYILVDHSIFRAIDKGAVGLLKVTGNENPEIYSTISSK